MLHKCDLNYQTIAKEQLSLNLPMCLSTRAYFFPANKLSVSLFSVFVGMLFCKGQGQWSCGQDSVFPDFNLCLGTKLHLWLLQADTTQDQDDIKFFHQSSSIHKAGDTYHDLTKKSKNKQQFIYDHTKLVQKQSPNINLATQTQIQWLK